MSFILFFFLFMTMRVSTGLSEGEEMAISDLFQGWPFLANLSPPWSSNSSEACIVPFKGLECSKGLDQHILSLDFQAIDQSGVIHYSIGKLSWLRSLNLEVNTFGNALPDSIGSLTNLQILKLKIVYNPFYLLPGSLGELINLSRLELSLQGFHGHLPDEISKLSNLEHFSLVAVDVNSDKKSFGGPIPLSFCDLNKLVSIEFQWTDLSGFEICAGKLPNLEVLNLANAPQMSLPLQTLVGDRPGLRILNISDTPIFGPLKLDGQVNFESIRFSGTNISGTLPDTLWNNKNLSELSMQRSDVGGTLSSAIGTLTQLETLLVRETLLSGTIPPVIGLCKMLHTFDASATSISGTLPDEIGYLPNLRVLDLSSTLIVGSIPPSFSQLVSLTHLLLENCNLLGTIPPGVLSLPALSKFVATHGGLTGTIPDEITSACNTLELDSNFLEGTIPSSALRYCSSVYLSQNRLSGQIGNISSDSKLTDLSIWGNAFTGSLPHISANAPCISLELASNQISGTIHDHYRTICLQDVDFTRNLLEGDISPLFENQQLDSADLGDNRFRGTIPNSFSTSTLSRLSIPNNFITGTIPPIPSQLDTLIITGNLFHGSLNNIFRQPNSLSHVDLSHNLFEGSLPSFLSFVKLSFLSLASNKISGSISPIPSSTRFEELQVLDFSNNDIEGQFPFNAQFVRLSSLLLANNSFNGTIPLLPNLYQLSILDISNNQFSFDASVITSNAYISLISAQNNLIYGSLSFYSLPSLKYADFRTNNITNIHFGSIYTLSQKASLSSISVKSNPTIVSIDAYEQLIRDGILSLSSTTYTSPEHQGVICSQLLIGDNVNTQFIYDDSMFSFRQCRCDQDHFGRPPFDCSSCHTLIPGSSVCSGNLVHIERNYYVYNTSNSLQTELCVSRFLYSIELNHGHSRISNCMGLVIEYDANTTRVLTSESGFSNDASYSPSNLQLSLQCHVGSSGRLCSHCNCDVTLNDSSCYYPGPAGICEKCKKVFHLREYLPICLAILIVVIAVLGLVFQLILASKRSTKKEWKNISIGRRVVYRLVDLTSFGQLTILVTFVQILVELTNWDAYALRSWLNLVNGASEGLGLRCFFPFLSNPATLLVLRLLLPMMVIAIVCVSIVSAEMVRRVGRKLWYSCSVSDSETTYDDDGTNQTTLLINSEPAEGKTPYPIMALATSTSISVIKFFYFGTTIAAAEYLFYSVQNGTGKRYVQTAPWMSFEDARTLRTISIPFLAVYLFGIPFGFVVVSWRLRHKISSPFVRKYFGSLFENYHRRLFWWELVNVFRKVAVALLLRGLSAGDSLRPFFISFILGSIGVISASLKPWKRGTENFFDGIGSLLLILSMASNLLGTLTHSRQVRIIIVVFDGIYIGACVLVIAWRIIRDETSYEKEWKLKYGNGSHPSILPISEDYGPPLLNNDDVVLDEVDG